MSIVLGQNVNYINLIENGKRFPSLRGFFSICDCLGCSPQDFFGESIESTEVNDEEIEILHREFSNTRQSIKSKQSIRWLLHIYFSLPEPQRNLLLSVADDIQRCLRQEF